MKKERKPITEEDLKAFKESERVLTVPSTGIYTITSSSNTPIRHLIYSLTYATIYRKWYEFWKPRSQEVVTGRSLLGEVTICGHDDVVLNSNEEITIEKDDRVFRQERDGSSEER